MSFWSSFLSILLLSLVVFIDDRVVESLKVITAEKSQRIAEYAFEYAAMNNRSKVSAIHKANIMKQSDGMFLDACRRVAAKYPNIQYEEMIVDNTCMQLVSKPEQFDVMVTPNLVRINSITSFMNQINYRYNEN